MMRSVDWATIQPYLTAGHTAYAVGRDAGNRLGKDKGGYFEIARPYGKRYRKPLRREIATRWVILNNDLEALVEDEDGNLPPPQPAPDNSLPDPETDLDTPDNSLPDPDDPDDQPAPDNSLPDKPWTKHDEANDWLINAGYDVPDDWDTMTLAEKYAAAQTLTGGT